MTNELEVFLKDHYNQVDKDVETPKLTDDDFIKDSIIENKLD